MELGVSAAHRARELRCSSGFDLIVFPLERNPGLARLARLIGPAVTACVLLAAQGCGSSSNSTGDDSSAGTSDESADSGGGSCEATLESIHTTILAPKCGIAGCHGATEPAGALDLSTTANIVGQLVDARHETSNAT
jgi:hypothetical protein